MFVLMMADRHKSRKLTIVRLGGGAGVHCCAYAMASKPIDRMARPPR